MTRPAPPRHEPPRPGWLAGWLAVWAARSIKYYTWQNKTSNFLFLVIEKNNVSIRGTTHYTFSLDICYFPMKFYLSNKNEPFRLVCT